MVGRTPPSRREPRLRPGSAALTLLVAAVCGWALPTGLALAQPVTVTGETGEETPPEPRPVLTPPSLREFAEATYPQAAEAAGLEATVELELTIAADGTVGAARVVTPVGHGFDEAAVEAARRFLFNPARRNDAAIPARIRYRYVFELRAPEPVEPDPAAAEPDEPPPPSPGRLEGRVLGRGDEDPIVGAEVLLSSADGATNRRAVITGAGTFLFDDLPPGTYEVRVLADGHAEVIQNEEVVSDEVTDLTYRLDRTDDVEMFEAVAVVDPPPREVTRRTISREELTRVPGTRGDALRTIELLPGVARPPALAGLIVVRGAAPQDSQVFFDGMPVPLLYHFGGLTSFTNSRLLERIDFFPGNFSARYGRKMGGIVEVGSRDPANDAVHGVADINLLDASLMIEAPIGEDAAIALAYRRSYIDTFFDSIVPSGVFDVVAAPIYYDYQLFATYRPSSKDRLRFLLYGSSDEFRLVFDEPPGNDPAIRGNLEFATAFHRAHLGWRRQLSSDLDQDLSVSVGPSTLTFGLGEDLNFDLTTMQIYGRSEWRGRLSNRVRVIAGMDVLVAPSEINFRGPPLQQGEGNPGGASLSAQTISDFSEEVTAYRPGAYVETDLRPADPLQIVMGLRLDWDRAIEEWSFDPRLVGLLDVSDDTRLKAGLGLFSQPPEFQESAARLGNPDLEMQQSIHTGLGIEQTLAEGMTLGAEGFYKQLWNRVVGTEGGLPPRFTNEGIGRIYGLEISGRIQPQGRRYFGFLSYTLSRSERKDHAGDDWRLFDFDQTHILTLAMVYRLGRGWELGGTFRLVSGNPTTPVAGSIYNANADLYTPTYGDTNSDRNPLFNRLDVRMEKLWRFDSWKLAFYIDVQNVYNATNREGVTYNYDFTQSADVPGLPIIPSLGFRGEL